MKRTIHTILNAAVLIALLVGLGAMLPVQGMAKTVKPKAPKATVTPVPAQDIHLALAKESKLWLEGNSTLHPFKADATLMEASFEVSQAGLGKAKNAAELFHKIIDAGAVKKFTLNITVLGLKSGDEGLDKNMYPALKADKNPVIKFELQNYQASPLTATAQGAMFVASEGKLTIGGKENAIKMSPKVSVGDDGIHIAGSQEVIMTDYGIQPPSMMFVINVDKKVVIKFDLLVRLQKTEK